MAPHPADHSPARSFGIAFVAAIVGSAFVAVGWIIPSQFKSLPVSVLAEAGRGSDGLRQAVRAALDDGRPGAAGIYAQAATAVKLPGAESTMELVRQFQIANPDIAPWGEANPYVEGAVPKNAGRALDPNAGAIRHFLPAATRRSITTYLGNSRNAAVRAVLSTRDLATYRQFLPIHSAGGAPLETTILLTALLIESGQLDGAVVREIRALAEQAKTTGEAASIELIYLDFLSLGQRYNWGQLAALVRDVGSLEVIAQIRHLHKVAPDSAPVLAAATLLTEDPDAVTKYILAFGERGNEALAFALFHGQGSLDLLVRQQLPPDGELSLPAVPAAEGTAFGQLVEFALHHPRLAVAAKIAAYLLGGLLLFIAAERLTALRRIELSPVFTAAARFVGATVICLFLIVINEPYLALGSEPAGFELQLVIPVLGAANSESMPAKTLPIDAPTILSISFFFLLQALVFLICMLKLRDIDSKPVPPQTKLRLAENEENLFDSGLYVGIAGTCIALVLQVMGVIQANLLAAYSSNLFGILGVAFIKIRHVRPFKQRLILQVEEAHQREVAVAASAPPVPHSSGVAGGPLPAGRV